MIKVEWVKSDIIYELDNSKYNYLLQQNNCVTGSQVLGLAFAINKRYDKVRYYLDTSKTENFFGHYVNINVDKESNKNIVCLFSQYYPGSPSNRKIISKSTFSTDSIENRKLALEKAFSLFLEDYYNLFKENKDIYILCPLLASGLAKPRDSKLSDKEYFTNEILPIFLSIGSKSKINIHFKIVYL